MDPTAFFHLVQDGVHPVVEFGRGIAAAEGYLEPGMRARVVSVEEDDHEMYLLVVDLSEFEDFNRAFELPNFYDREHVARLTAREAGKYPKDNRESFYVMMKNPQAEDFTFDDYLTVLDAERLALYDRFRQSEEGTSYVQWLESQVLQSQ